MEVSLDIEKLVETVLDLEISVPLRSLAGVSTAIQKEIKKQVTKARLPLEPSAQVNIQMTEDRPLIKVESLPLASFTLMDDVSEEVPEGYMVAADPILQYLLTNKDVEPRDLIVAKPSEDLRSIYATVNQTGEDECVMDSGSQIISMSKAAAVQFGLIWDHSIQVNMESASNHLEETLGLAWDVRLTVGGLNLFLQVHILENPPYKILLGRLFDTLTSSILKTKADGSSEIVITDPNSKKVATVPTYPRGQVPESLQKQTYQSF